MRRSRGEYTLVRSGNRTPKRSSFGPHERIGAQQVDVIVDHHQVAGSKTGVDTSGRIREDQDLDAEHPEHPRRKRDGAEIVPFIEMRAARQAQPQAGPRPRQGRAAPRARRRPTDGQFGISSYGIGVCRSRLEAKSPSPDPSTTAISGMTLERERTSAAARCTWS